MQVMINFDLHTNIVVLIQCKYDRQNTASSMFFTYFTTLLELLENILSNNQQRYVRTFCSSR